MALPCFAHLLQVNNLPWECFNPHGQWNRYQSILPFEKCPKWGPLALMFAVIPSDSSKTCPILPRQCESPSLGGITAVRASLANPKKMCQVGWKDLQTVFSLPLVYDHLTTQTRRTKQSNRTNAGLCRTQQHMKHIEWIRAESCRPSWRTSSRGGRLFLSIGLRNSKI
jgi:hypothetical protein